MLKFSGKFFYLSEEHTMIKKYSELDQYERLLIDGARSGDFTSVVSALVNNVNVNLKVKMDEHEAGDYTFPLWEAAINGHDIIVQYLIMPTLHSATNVNIRDEYGNTALYAAVLSGNEAVLQALLDSDKVDYLVENYYGQNIVQFAFANEQAKLAKVIMHAVLNRYEKIEKENSEVINTFKKLCAEAEKLLQKLREAKTLNNQLLSGQNQEQEQPLYYENEVQELALTRSRVEQMQTAEGSVDSSISTIEFTSPHEFVLANRNNSEVLRKAISSNQLDLTVENDEGQNVIEFAYAIGSLDLANDIIYAAIDVYKKTIEINATLSNEYSNLKEKIKYMEMELTMAEDLNHALLTHGEISSQMDQSDYALEDFEDTQLGSPDVITRPANDDESTILANLSELSLSPEQWRASSSSQTNIAQENVNKNITPELAFNRPQSPSGSPVGSPFWSRASSNDDKQVKDESKEELSADQGKQEKREKLQQLVNQFKRR